MKATGITRQVDELGRIVIPVELRRTFEINEKDFLEIYVDSNNIILKKYEPLCTFCGSSDDLFTFEKRNVCKACAKKLQILAE